VREGHYRLVYHAGMMVEDVILVMLILAVIEPLWYLIAPGYLCSRRKLCCLKKSADGKRVLNMDQEELNELYEKEEVELAEQILNNFALFIIALVYVSLIPLGILLSTIGFLLNYIFFKYKLLKSHARPEQLNEKSIMTLVDNMPYFVLLSIYMLFFHTYLQLNESLVLAKSEYPILHDDYVVRMKVVGIYAIVMTVWMLIPHSFWMGCISCICKRQTAPYLKYRDFATSMAAHYDRCNPITMKQGRKRMIKLYIEK